MRLIQHIFSMHSIACGLRLAAIIGGLSLMGCTTYRDYGAFVKDPRPVVTTTEYRIAPPDVITISSKRVREINGHTEQVRPDGKITLPLLGSFNVTGKTPEECSAELEKLAKEYYEDADVSLRVAGFNSKRIFVFGEVNSPGPYAYTGTNTILDTLAVAQPTRLADPDHIHILRPDRHGKLVKRMTINMNDMVKRGDTTLDAVLEEGDIMYVPANGLAAIGLAMQQVLLPIQPAAATVRGPADISGTMQSRPYGTSTQTRTTP
ncbi:MAG: polysaccharide biosynthesis/export family protein [Phycisphaeraceae bacterium]|nr:polysaccharide biosynthesis/export family protein [Phycisphaeraceae bacterium]